MSNNRSTNLAKALFTKIIVNGKPVNLDEMEDKKARDYLLALIRYEILYTSQNKNSYAHEEELFSDNPFRERKVGRRVQSDVLPANYLLDLNFTSNTPDKNKKKKIQIQLRNEVVYAPTDDDPYKFKFYVQDEVLGQGSYGVVSKTLDTHGARSIFSMPKKHILKEFKKTDEEDRASIQKEEKLLKKIPRAHAKNTIAVESLSATSVPVSRYFQSQSELGDMDLTRFIANVSPHTNPVVLHTIAINLFRALKEYHEVFKLLHRDIKPQNIRINSKTLEVYLVDVGLSIEVGKSDNQSLGTDSYAAPEMVIGEEVPGWAGSRTYNAGTHSDVYSMLLVIAQLYGEDRFVVTAETIKLGRIRGIHNLPGSTVNFTHLTDQAKKTSKPISDEVAKLTKDIIILDPKTNESHRTYELRPTCDAMLTILEKVRLDAMRNQSVNKWLMDDIEKANSLARELTKQLQVEKQKLTPGEFVSVQCELIVAAVKKLPSDEPDVITEFLSTAHLNIFGLSLKDSAIDGIDENLREGIFRLPVPLGKQRMEREDIINYVTDITKNFGEGYTALGKTMDQLEDLRYKLIYLINSGEKIPPESKDFLAASDGVRWVTKKLLKSDVNLEDMQKLNIAFNSLTDFLKDKKIASPKNVSSKNESSTALDQSSELLKKIRGTKNVNINDETGSALVGNLKDALQRYMMNTVSKNNLRRGKRLASAARKGAIEKISEKMASAQSADALVDDINQYFKSREFKINKITGLNGLFGTGLLGSKLYQEVQVAIKEYQRQNPKKK